MKTNSFLVFSAFLCCLTLTSCSKRGLIKLCNKQDSEMPAQVEFPYAVVKGRICEYKELQRYFTDAQDLFHYYHLLHLRVENTGFARYSLHADHQSFFVPPASNLRQYTKSEAAFSGSVVSWITSLMLLPFYAINALKGTVENPYLVQTGNDHSIIIPRHFAFLTALYAGVSLAPIIMGCISGTTQSDKYFREAKSLILSQYEQRAVPPYKTRDILILTPRAGFVFDCPITLYNHHTKQRESAVLPLRPAE